MIPAQAVVSGRSHLESLQREHMAAYLTHHLEVSGGKGELFADDAVREKQRATTTGTTFAWMPSAAGTKVPWTRRAMPRKKQIQAASFLLCTLPFRLVFRTRKALAEAVPAGLATGPASPILSETRYPKKIGTLATCRRSLYT